MKSCFFSGFAFLIALGLNCCSASANDDETSSKYTLSKTCAKLFARFADPRDWNGNRESLAPSLGRRWEQIMLVRSASARLQNWHEKPERGSQQTLKWTDVERSLLSLDWIQGDNATLVQCMVSMAHLIELSTDKSIALPSQSTLTEMLAKIQAATTAADAEKFKLELCVAASVSENIDFANGILPASERPGNFAELLQKYENENSNQPPGKSSIDLIHSRLAAAFKETDDRSEAEIRSMMDYNNPQTKVLVEGRPGTSATTRTAASDDDDDDDEKNDKANQSSYLEAEQFLLMVKHVLGSDMTDRESTLALEIAANSGLTVAQVANRILETRRIGQSDD